MINSDDIALLSGWFIGCFGVGLAFGFLIGLFIVLIRAATYHR